MQLNPDIPVTPTLTYASVIPGSEAFVLAELLRKHHTIIHIMLDDMHMARTEATLAFFFPEVDILNLPAWDCIPYDRISPNNTITSQRIATLSRLLHHPAPEQGRIILTTINAALTRMLPKSLLNEASFPLKTGETIPRDDLTDFLVHNGYTHTAAASEPGEFSLRGSIVDIIPVGHAEGLRLDFFDNELETIRSFDPLTQITLPNQVLSSFTLMPASEIILNEDTIRQFRQRYRELFGPVTSDDPLYDAVSDGRKYAGMEHWLPLFYDQLDSLFDYIPGAAITLDHLVDEAWLERESLVQDSYETRQEALSMMQESSYRPIPPELLYMTEDHWQQQLGQRIAITLHPFDLPASEQVTLLPYTTLPQFHTEALATKQSAFTLMQEHIRPKVVKGKGKQKTKALIACMSEGSRDRIARMLGDYDIPYVLIDNWPNQHNALNHAGTVGLAILPLENGFRTDSLTLITEQDLLGEKLFRSQRKQQKPENFLTEASTLSPGELVVHKEHGIGRFEGLETLEVQGITHDFLKLVYHGGDRLYVPVENIEVISRYGDADDTTQLDKLGGLAWQQRTATARKRIKVATEELMEIAAKRATRQASEYHLAPGAYEEFCSRFPFSETKDQLHAIDDVMKDLRSGKPMDRLLCGDVGFGKTEVALRAAFMVTHPTEEEEKGQVALIAPTTLLCRQHYASFKQRFAGLGIEIRQLSRMVSAKEQKETREMMEAGMIDIVIGTHALLGKDTKFHNLALLIVDEEQRFGVAQKERLKKLRSNTHILTMTATPIPRTLQLSLAGIRDLSLIATPPVDRLAVRTYVMPYDPIVIREAILREYYRGGRSFYVCPRVKDIEEMEPVLRELVPEVKIVSAHGQMPATQLDKIMNEFYDGTYDVLLATTIVESGLDVPMANTLVIHRADMYGLSQLYQIRGRVGRSKIRAYAYLTLPPKHIPTQQAMKRLEVMQKLDTLGAGFTLASHDMDIRGFGNLLGDEQSGHIKEIGVELYQAMLREAIEAHKAEAEEEAETNLSQDYSAKINLNLSVLIPESYVSDVTLRMGLYRRIAALESNEEVESMAAELIDRFGPLPEEVDNLLAIVHIKQLCHKAGIYKLDAGSKGAVIEFYNDHFANPDALITHATNHLETYKIRGDQKLVVHNQEWDCTNTRLKGIRKIVQEIGGLVA